MCSLLADAFHASLRTDPGAAVAWTPGGVRDRAALDAAARAVDARLADLAPGLRIGISVRDGFRFLAAFLALARRGDAALLLDAADPRAPRVDLAQRFGAAAIVADEPELAVQRLCGAAPAGDVRVIKLTSGSTDEPQAIAVTDAQLVADAEALESTMGIGDGDRVLAAVPMSFSYGVGNLLVPALARGRCLVLPDPKSPLGLLRALRDGEPTVLPAVPALLRALLQGGCALPSSLRLVLSAGAVLLPELALECRRSFGLPVHVFYGASECGGISYDRTGTAAERGTVGTPVESVQVELGPGGRVIVQSAAVGTDLGGGGNPAGGRFTTADLGAFEGGELVLRGRAGDVFDVGGHKVEPREIERIIASLPGVEDVAVVAWRDEHGRASCAALVAVGAPGGPDEAAVRRHCAGRLPAAKVPRCVVVVASLPRTDRGKLPRAEVERLLAGACRSAAGTNP